MKRYLLSYSCLDKDHFPTCSCSFLNIAPKGLSFNMGEPLPIKIKNPIEYGLNKDLPLDDLVYANMFQFLVSSPLCRLAMKHSTCIRTYSSRIMFSGELVSDEYTTLNFEESFSVLDWQQSEFTKDVDRPDKVRRIKRLIIDTKKIPANEGIFRLFEAPGNIILSEAFKCEYEELGLTGIRFLDIESNPTHVTK